MSVDIRCIDTMLSAWNTRDRTRLVEVVEESLSPDIKFCDPRHDIQGHSAFMDMVEAFWTEHTGCLIRRASLIDAHHDRARYAWAIEWPDGRRFDGFDAVRLDLGSGKVRRVDGFFGPLALD